MAWTNAKKFVDKFLTKNKIGNEFVEEEVTVKNKFDCFIKNDLAEFYCNYENGSDLNDGLTSSTPLKTFDRMIELCRDYGCSSAHFYFMSGGDYIANNYKNIGGISIHFHSRAEGIRLIFRNEATSRVPNEDYTAFYGCHYNFGSTQKKSDGFNFKNRTTVIFQSPDTWTYGGATGNVSNTYFENCSTVFNGCDIYSQDLNGNNRVNGCIGFAGGNVELQQCRCCCMILFSYTNAFMRNTCTLLQTDNLCALRCINSKVLYWNDLQTVNNEIVPSWEYLYRIEDGQVINFGNVYRINTGRHQITEAVFTLNGCTELNFYNNSSYLIQNSPTSVTNLINRVILSRGASIVCSDVTLIALNLFNHSGDHQYKTILDNYAQLTTVNGRFNKILSNGVLIGS